MNGIMSDRPLIRRIDRYIKELKENEERKKEYMLMQAFEMDARKDGIQQGKSIGLAEGSRQAKLETARMMKAEALASDLIMKITGLSKEEVEAID